MAARLSHVASAREMAHAPDSKSGLFAIALIAYVSLA
jgi:hypothetical protein